MFDSLAAFKAVADASRLRMLQVLARTELAVTDLTQILRQSQPRVSRHLKVLTDAGLVERHKEGAWVYYRLAGQGRAAEVVRILVDLADSRDAEHLRDVERLQALLAHRSAIAEQFFARHATEWDHIRSLHVAEAEVEAAIVMALTRQPIQSLLDIGTGTGRMLELLAPYAARGIGIDNSREMLSIARAKLESHGLTQMQVRQGDMYDLSCEGTAYDTIIMHQVLHFADDPQAVISKAASVLAVGGQVLIADFAPHDKDFLREQQGHRRLGFSDAQMLDYMTRAGLRAQAAAHLTGGDLTVILWHGVKGETVHG